MLCANCGQPFSGSQQKFCSNCGSSRNFDTQVIVTSGRSQSITQCPYCAQELTSEASACRYCGRWILKLPNELGDPVIASESPVRLVLKLTAILEKQIEQRIESSGVWIFKKETMLDDHIWSPNAPYEAICELQHMTSGHKYVHRVHSGFMELLSLPILMHTRVGSIKERKIVRDVYRVPVEDRIRIYIALSQMVKLLFTYGWNTSSLLIFIADYLEDNINTIEQKSADSHEPWDIVAYREGYEKEEYRPVENPNLRDVYIVNIQEPAFTRQSGPITVKILSHDFESRH